MCTGRAKFEPQIGDSRSAQLLLAVPSLGLRVAGSLGAGVGRASTLSPSTNRHVPHFQKWEEDIRRSSASRGGFEWETRELMKKHHRCRSERQDRDTGGEPPNGLDPTRGRHRWREKSGRGQFPPNMVRLGLAVRRSKNLSILSCPQWLRGA